MNIQTERNTILNQLDMVQHVLARGPERRSQGIHLGPRLICRRPQKRNNKIIVKDKHAVLWIFKIHSTIR